MSREPWFAKYLRAEKRREVRAEDELHVSELTFALQALTWFQGVRDE